MTEYFSIKASVIQWACFRAGEMYSALMEDKKFANLKKENKGYVQLTMSTLQRLSKLLRYPVAYFFFEEPVYDYDKLSINDFRKFPNSSEPKNNIDLKEQIDFCIGHQDWFREYIQDYDPVYFKFNSKFSITDDPIAVARSISDFLHLETINSLNISMFFKSLKEKLENHYILIESSKVLKNTKYRLNLDEFRGFALADKNVPLIFINANDSSHGQIFTLFHELGHICLGVSGVSDTDLFSKVKTEKWCNEFAANILMPKDAITRDYQEIKDLEQLISNSQKKYHVSSFAFLIRLLNLNLIKEEQFKIKYEEAEEKYKNFITKQNEDKKNGGGNYYNSVKSRESQLFAKSVILSTLSGETTYRDALNLLDIKTIKTFNKLSSTQGGF